MPLSLLAKRTGLHGELLVVIFARQREGVAAQNIARITRPAKDLVSPMMMARYVFPLHKDAWPEYEAWLTKRGK